jgi:small subunit ribosomal protein S6
MRNYEVMFILKPDLEEEVYGQFIEKYSAIITDGGGEVVSVDKWGKRRLAYEIMDLHEGFYVLLTFKSEPAVVTELDRVMKIADEMMRFMIINKDEK